MMVAEGLHLSQRQFFRYRAQAIEAIAVELERLLTRAPARASNESAGACGSTRAAAALARVAGGRRERDAPLRTRRGARAAVRRSLCRNGRGLAAPFARDGGHGAARARESALAGAARPRARSEVGRRALRVRARRDRRRPGTFRRRAARRRSAQPRPVRRARPHRELQPRAGGRRRRGCAAQRGRRRRPRADLVPVRGVRDGGDVLQPRVRGRDPAGAGARRGRPALARGARVPLGRSRGRRPCRGDHRPAAAQRRRRGRSV